MDYLVICTVALVASGLTLVSGFGLGTLLLPAFSFFFPLEISVALTAVVHLANNLYKLALVGPRADRRLVVAFGLPAFFLAVVGAVVLRWLAFVPAIARYELGGRIHEITPLALVVAALLIVLAIAELLPSLQRASIPAKWLPLGGALSGFFGGITGQQGALRSAFLLRFKEGLTVQSFIATNVVIAVMVDVGRLAIYGTTFSWSAVSSQLPIVAAATGSAFIGATLGARLIDKITLKAVQRIVAVLLIVIALALASGITR